MPVETEIVMVEFEGAKCSITHCRLERSGRAEVHDPFRVDVESACVVVSRDVGTAAAMGV